MDLTFSLGRARGAAAAVLMLAGALAGTARSQAFTQTWTFDQTTTGQDIAWTAPSTVHPSASVFDTSYLITKVEVKVKYLFFTFTLDVTDQVPPDQLAGSGPVPGPAPITLFDNVITYPDPPAAPALSAHVTSGLNAAGAGTFTATGVTLGTTTVGLGPPFRLQPLTITSVRIAGSITMHTTWFDLAQPLPGTGGAPLLVGRTRLPPRVEHRRPRAAQGTGNVQRRRDLRDQPRGQLRSGVRAADPDARPLRDARRERARANLARADAPDPHTAGR